MVLAVQSTILLWLVVQGPNYTFAHFDQRFRDWITSVQDDAASC